MGHRKRIGSGNGVDTPQLHGDNTEVKFKYSPDFPNEILYGAVLNVETKHHLSFYTLKIPNAKNDGELATVRQCLKRLGIVNSPVWCAENKAFTVHLGGQLTEEQKALFAQHAINIPSADVEVRKGKISILTSEHKKTILEAANFIIEDFFLGGSLQSQSDFMKDVLIRLRPQTGLAKLQPISIEDSVITKEDVAKMLEILKNSEMYQSRAERKGKASVTFTTQRKKYTTQLESIVNQHTHG